MLRDVEHLTSRLGKVDGFGDLGTYLMKIIEGKDIKAVVPPAPPAPADAEESATNEDSGEVKEAEGDDAHPPTEEKQGNGE